MEEAALIKDSGVGVLETTTTKAAGKDDSIPTRDKEEETLGTPRDRVSERNASTEEGQMDSRTDCTKVLVLAWFKTHEM